MAGVVPGVAAREGIVQVHAGHDDHAAVIGFLDGPEFRRIFVQGLERNFAPVHEGGDIHRVDGRIVTADIFRVRSAFRVLPLAPVQQVVLVSEHPSLLPDGPQVGIEGFGGGGGVRIGQSQPDGLDRLFGTCRLVPPARSAEGDGRKQQHEKEVFTHYSEGTCFSNTITYRSGLFTKRS